MRTPSIWARAAAATACGIATIAVAACSPTAPAATTADVVTATTPVVVDCAVHAQTRPGQYTLACAGGEAYLSGLRWASWGPSAAFADGTSTFNDCTPSCVAGHGHSFPVLVALWRAEPWPGHSGQRYFTRLTIIYTGNRTYHADGKQVQLPVTVTDPLSPFGGA